MTDERSIFDAMHKLYEAVQYDPPDGVERVVWVNGMAVPASDFYLRYSTGSTIALKGGGDRADEWLSTQPPSDARPHK